MTQAKRDTLFTKSMGRITEAASALFKRFSTHGARTQCHVYDHIIDLALRLNRITRAR